MLFKGFILFVVSFWVGVVYGQHRYNENWYFGRGAAISFNTNPPMVKSDCKMSTYNGSASVSNPNTGALLFYTNGNSFWNAQGQMIDSAYQGTEAQDAIIIPLKQYENRFMVFNFTHYYIVDMAANNGKGQILSKTPFALQASANRITAVKHCLSEAYWLISIRGNRFYAYLVHPNGTIDAPVISTHNLLNSSVFIGDFVSSLNGEKLAITNYITTAPFVAPQVFSFDKRCGTVLPDITLLPMQTGWDAAHGIAFSPSGQYVYVAYGYQESHLVQYEVANPNNWVLIATSPQNFNQIACAPDGKLYITTHISGIPSNKLDVLLFPNNKGAACQYRENYIRLTGTTSFEVPNMIMNHTGTCAENKGFKIEHDSVTCLGQAINFNIADDRGGIDSLRWFYISSQQAQLSSTQYTTAYVYTNTGNYKAALVIYFCGKKDTFYLDVLITLPQNIKLGNDTILCPLSTLQLGNVNWKGTNTWNTGATTPTINVSAAGTYGLINKYRGCTLSDSINVAYYPTLETLLGDAYFLCEETNDLVELDAGKGFYKYLWQPTLDTTQWIIVGKKGNYFVLVEDFRGCKGNDNTIVEERCDLRVFIPNAFTPNGDGLNDELDIYTNYATHIGVKIYNRWGQLIFDNSHGEKWNGMHNNEKVEEGLYLVKAEITGFYNKKKVVKNYVNLVHVVY